MSRVGRRRRTSRREPWDLLSGLSGLAWTSKAQPRLKQKLWKADNIILQRWPHIAAQSRTLAGECPAAYVRPPGAGRRHQPWRTMMDAHERLESQAILESRRLTKAGWPPGSPKEDQVKVAWRVNRPKMVARLTPKGLTALAHVLVDRWHRARVEYLKAGMPPTDANEQAEREWLLQEPETDDPPGLPPSARITSFPTPRT